MTPSRIAAFAAVAVMLTACRGAATLPQLPQSPLSETASSAPAGSTAGGIVNTKVWNVAAGKTVRVTKNLAVFASTSITISGTLVVPRGIQIAFFTPSFTVMPSSNGNVTAVKNGKYAGPVNDFVSACHIDIQNGAIWQVGSGDNVGITSSTKQNANPKQPCTALFGAGFAMQDGAIGGSDKKRPNGQNGGSIVIGTTDAIARTQALAKTDGHKTLKAFAPDIVEVDAGLTSANGGAGKDDKTGTAAAGGYSFTGTNGGQGGTIEIATGKITGSNPKLTGGYGGNGGALAAFFFSAATSSGAYKLTGTAGHPNGYSLTFVQGAGGGGGSISIQAKSWPSRSVWRPGNGGSPSIFFGEEAGSGYYRTCQNCILAGSGLSGLAAAPGSGTSNGGSVELDLASVGKKGTGDRKDKPLPVNGSYAKITVEGGTGGSWTQGAFNTGATGGNGSDFTVVPPRHIAITSLKQFGLSISITDFGNGGPGEYWCPDTPPATGAGFSGGNGGHLYDNGLLDYITIATFGSSTSSKALPNSFNGGNGSGGNPPGAGGTGGSSDEGSIGENGKTGTAC